MEVDTNSVSLSCFFMGDKKEEGDTEAFEMALAPFPLCSPHGAQKRSCGAPLSHLATFFLFYDILGFCCPPSQT